MVGNIIRLIKLSETRDKTKMFGTLYLLNISSSANPKKMKTLQPGTQIKITLKNKMQDYNTNRKPTSNEEKSSWLSMFTLKYIAPNKWIDNNTIAKNY